MGIRLSSLVWVTAAGPGGPGGPGGPPAAGGQSAGGAVSLLRIEDSETGSGFDSESEPPTDQDPPEQDSASE